MPGVRALRKIQLAKETTAGTAISTATVIWRGNAGGMIHDKREVLFPTEDVGYLGGTTRSYIARYWSELSMEETEATFEQLPYMFEAGVAAETATQDGTGSGYIYNYLAPTTAQNTLNTYTVQGGDDQQAERFAYGFVKSFSLSGSGQGALMVSSEWVGRQTADATFTSLSLATFAVEEILVNKGTLYIDSTTIGATPVSATLLAVNLVWTTGLQEYWAVDGSKDFSLVKQTGDEIVLKLTYEHNASAVSEKDNYQAGSTVRLIRLKFTGSTLTTAGTSYSVKTAIMDFAGVYEDWAPLGEENGNDVVEATLRVRYDPTAALKASATIVNQLSALK